MHISLCGQWSVRKKGDAEAIPATVPGCIHTDLLAAGKIDDPYYRDNEAKQMWIGETDWVYSRTFTIDPETLRHDRVLLRCEGLDTLATITINTALIGTTNNQFRTYEFDVKSDLQAGKNVIEICFETTIPVIRAEQQKRYLNLTGVGHHRVDGSNRIRKSQCNYGWDWGPICVTAGIWRPISLLAFHTARLTDVQIVQDHSHPGSVGLHVVIDVEPTNTIPLLVNVSVSFEGTPVCQTQTAIQANAAEADLTIANPKLWWPNDLGDQPLYDVKVELLHQNTVLDTISKRIGLRILSLDRHPDQWGESFQFVINGRPFFAKGANWIPADTFVTRVSKDHYTDLIQSAADVHMNMLRVWGGGIYEDDEFYTLCDAHGICVWQDLMFACSAYPEFDAAFMDNVRQEIAQNVKRLRHHPSIALWCGNNELEHLHRMLLGETSDNGRMTWDEYRRMFDQEIPAVVNQHDPERPYWPSSSHSPVGDRKDPNNPRSGDAHLWEVWHGRQPFEWYRTCEHRFNSEFGFQSFPEPAVVDSYTEPEDRNITSYIMEWHQRSQIGNDAIIQYMLSWFRLPTRFDMLLWLSQILHGIGMKYAVEHWRRSMPRGMGTLYWQINDCWPVASWASIDYYRNWKALHYMARDFFAPLLISGVEHPQTGTVEIHVTSDQLQPVSGVVQWLLTDTEGNTLANDQFVYDIPSCSSQKVTTLEFADYLARYGGRRLLIWLELSVDHKVVSRNFISFIRPKHLNLLDPELTTRVQARAENSFEVTIEAKHPALWVWLDLPSMKAIYSDRFFHVVPSKPVTVTIQPKQPLSLAACQEQLCVNSLADTWNV